MRDEPIFILAVSPRCGSTWVQRCLTSTKDILIWGESWTSAFLGGDLWSDGNAEDSSGLLYYREHEEEMFMATLLPFYAEASAAYKRMAEDLYGGAAEREGFKRWGKKETIWHRIDCTFIRQQWPKAKMIFLVREFDLSYMSQFKRLAEVPGRDRAEEVRKMTSTWVDHMRTAFAFSNIEFGRVVQYEELCSGTVEEKRAKMIELAKWCGLENEPNWEKCDKQVSFHVRQPKDDLHSFRPCDLDIIWPYRDDVLEISSQLGHSQALGVKL